MRTNKEPKASVLCADSETYSTQRLNVQREVWESALEPRDWQENYLRDSVTIWVLGHVLCTLKLWFKLNGSCLPWFEPDFLL